MEKIILKIYLFGSIISFLEATKWIIFENKRNDIKIIDSIRIAFLSIIYSYIGIYLIRRARKGEK